MDSPYRHLGSFVKTEDGILAVRYMTKLAEQQGIACAVCGGLLMHLYGFTRATQQVDLVASQTLSLTPHKPLSFGGHAYTVTIDGQPMEIDWIVRDDELKDLYAAALQDKIILDEDIPALSPAWMVVLKHLAGRGKDHLDCVWLLRQDGLVDRAALIALLRSALGRHAFWAIKDMENLMLEADLMRARDEKHDKG